MAHEKQGDLGDLSLKTKAELIDLLARQEKLLTNKKFLSRLKDKGARVESFAEKLRKAIAEREEIDKAMQLFERMDLGKENLPISDVTERVPSIVDNKDKDEESTTEGISRTLNPAGALNASTTSIEKKKGRFKPNKDLKSTTIPSDLPRPSVKPEPMLGQSSEERLKVKHDEAELSSAVVPPLRNQEAQVVDMEESARLLQDQKKNVEALVAKHAAERLTERLNVKMGDFLPNIQQGSYRGQNQASDEDSDDDADDDEESENDAEDEEQDS